MRVTTMTTIAAKSPSIGIHEKRESNSNLNIYDHENEADESNDGGNDTNNNYGPLNKLPTLQEDDNDGDDTVNEEDTNEKGSAKEEQLTGADRPLSSSAFQVINQDYLGQIFTTGTGTNVKPNAIVRPVRRPEIPSGQKSNNSGILAEDANLKKTPSSRPGDLQKLDEFTKELDWRLRRLKREKQKTQKTIIKNANSEDSVLKRPLFISTVASGIFLPPPREPQAIKKRVYAYSSKPRIFTTLNAIPLRNNNNNNNNNNKNYNFEGDTIKPALITAKDIDRSGKIKNSRIEREIITSINGIRNFTHFLSSGASQKFREAQQPQEPYKNVMYDRRVVRGSNFTPSHLIPPWNPYFAYAGLLSGKGDGAFCVVKNKGEAEGARRRELIRKRILCKNQRGVLGTPPPVPGRKHEDVQTDKYLEELFDRPPEVNAIVQTDLFLQRPPSPPYVPAKIGIDVGTQILEGELFDFDLEVQPILEVLVGQSVEQSLVEVLHEEEIAELKRQKEEFIALREAELAEVRRLEAEEERLEAEKKRRLRQDEIAKELDAEVQERVTAAKLLQGHIAKILPEIMKNLEPLTDTSSREVLEEKLCPWLTREVSEEVGRIIDSREILIEIIKEIIKERAAIYGGYIDAEDEEEFSFTEEEQEKRDEFVNNEGIEIEEKDSNTSSRDIN